jgi:hypothetical protein
MKIYEFRIKPGQDLRAEIDKFVKDKEIKAGCVLTCVGHLKKATLRMASAVAGESQPIKEFDGPFEIVSLVGTVESGNSHLHISLSGNDGIVIGGHLKNGSIVGVTAEIVIGELENLTFTREMDSETGFEELKVNKHI